VVLRVAASWAVFTIGVILTDWRPTSPDPFNDVGQLPGN
jgi:hypothetical protein